MLNTLKAFMTPANAGLIAIIAFAVGLIAYRLFSRRESFSQWNIPMTVADFAKSPSKLQAVFKPPMVTDHDYYYDRFGG